MPTRPRTITGLLLLLARHRIARTPARVFVALGAVAGAAGVFATAHRTTRVPAVFAAHTVSSHCDRSGSFCLDARACHARGCVGLLHADDLPTVRGTDLALLPTIAANGSGWGVAWVGLGADSSRLVVRKVRADGAADGAAVTVGSFDELALFPQLAWNGRAYGLAWTVLQGEASVHARFMRVGADGRAIGAPVTLPGEGGDEVLPVIAGAERSWNVAWYSLRGDAEGADVRTLVFDESGRPRRDAHTIRRDVLATGGLGIASTSDGAALASSRYDVASQRGRVAVIRMAADGTERAEIRVAEDAQLMGGTALAMAGDSLAIAWQHGLLDPDERTSLGFARVTGDAVDVPPRPIVERAPGVDRPSLAWNGSEYGVVWHAHAGRGSDAFFARVGADGSTRGAAMRLSSGRGGAGFPAIAWSGDAWGAVWHEASDRGSDVLFARIDRAGRATRPVHVSDAR